MRISLPWPFRRRAPKPHVPEESLPFRLAILAASLSAAAGLAWATGLLLPVFFGSVALALGHRFSWRNRHRSTERVRGLLLLVLFLAIFWMLADLTVGVTGGVLPQAQFALYAQAITSFDLRTRRNLYTTSMHSLLITYVASAYGFDLIYGIFVLGYAGCFLAALAIAYLEDDAKSATGWQLRKAATSRLWTSVALFSLPSTVVFFLILPRSEGAALIMPAMVSLQLPASLRGEIAPPIFPFIEVSSGGSTGASPRMEIQTRGRFNQQAVMYVRSQIGSYWRGLALDRYDGASWETRIQRRDLRRSAGGGFDVPRLSGSATAQEYTQTFYIVQPQPNVVFSGYEARTVYFPDRFVFVDRPDDTEGASHEGVVQTIAPLRPGLTYAVSSLVPNWDAEALRRDRVVVPQATNADYLDASRASSQTRALALQITQGLTSDFEKASAIEQYLVKSFRYELELSPRRAGEDVVDKFLFREQAGFCQQFATAMAILARVNGLPTRLVTGYAPGDYNTVTGVFTVRALHAHAWVEVYFEKHGWVAFNPTPGITGPGARYGSSWLGNPLGVRLPTIDLAALAAPIGPAMTILLTALGPVVALGAVIGAVLFALLFLRRWRARRRDPLRRRSGLDETRRAIIALYLEAIRVLGKRGYPKREPHQTPAEYLAAVRERLGVERAAVERLTMAVVTAAYDPRPLPSNMLEDTRSWLTQLRRRNAGT